MTNLYVRSSDGNNADNGTTWALAKATWAGVGAIEAVGDKIWFSQAHSESTASAVTVSISASAASPTYMLCGDDSAEPPTSLANTAVIATTGANTITLNTAGSLYSHGINFKAGSGAVSASVNVSGFSNRFNVWNDCGFEVAGTTGGSIILGASAGTTKCVDCRFKFGATSSAINATSASVLIIDGGSVLSGSASITDLVSLDNSSTALISGMDLSNLHSAVNIFRGSSGGRGVIRNCKLPASWSGSVATSLTRQSDRFSLYNCDSSDTNYRLWIEAWAGSIKQETTIVLSGGASDGTTSISWCMATNADAKLPNQPLTSDEVVIWNDTTGSALTATVEIVHDSEGSGTGGRFTDDEIWLEVHYLGTSGYPLSSIVTDFKADIIATAADQADSTASWTTTGLSSPLKQKLEVTFTPQEKGFVVATVCMAKASATAYVDPAITVA